MAIPALAGLLVFHRATTHSARNLGFIFDEHLTFSDQITALSKSCYYHIRELRCIRPYLDFKTASTIATSNGIRVVESPVPAVTYLTFRSVVLSFFKLRLSSDCINQSQMAAGMGVLAASVPITCTRDRSLNRPKSTMYRVAQLK